MSLGLQYKDQKKIFQEIETDTPYLEYPLFQNTGIVHHGFSTRLGGVSEGCYSSLNLSFTRGDKEESVRENFRRIGEAMGIKWYSPSRLIPQMSAWLRKQTAEWG